MRRRARPTRSGTSTSIMELSYKLHRDLSEILDPRGTKDWKHVASMISEYTAKDVKLIETWGNKPGESFTRHLLQDMDNRGYNVDKLVEIIKMSGNEKAVRCLLDGLDDESLLHEEDAITSQNKKRCIKSAPVLQKPKRDKRNTRINEDTENRQVQIPGTRGTLMKDRPIHQPTDEVDLDNPNAGTRETSKIGHPNHQDGFGVEQELHNRSHRQNLPSENDETQYQDADVLKTRASMQHGLTMSSGQRLPTGHKDNKMKEESLTTWSPNPLRSIIMWMMNCGSQTVAG